MAQFFIGFGSQKSASTWLWHQLKNHPECDLPPYKEIHYFSRYPWYPTPSHLFLPWYLRVQEERRLWGGPRGFSSILKHLAKAKLSGNRKLFNYLSRYHLSREINDKWYLSLFEDYSSSVTGEITPAYSFLHCDDIHCMVKLIPDVKFIYIIRNPFDQLLSAVHHVQKKFLTSFKPSNAKSNPESRELSQDTLSYCLSDTLSHRINHGAVLKRLFNVVDKQRVLLIDYDSVSNEPSMVASQLSQFLDISESGFTTPSLIKRVFARRGNIINYEDLPMTYLFKTINDHASSAPPEITPYYDRWITGYMDSIAH